jgi:hypothetical protein
VRDEETVQLVKPQVPLILQQFFLLFDEIGSDEVMATLSVSESKEKQESSISRSPPCIDL